jgi:hypothetical protein
MKMRTMFVCLTILALVGIMVPGEGFATIISYPGRGSFPDNNYVDWSQFGPAFTPVPSGSVATAGFFGTTVTVANGLSTNMQRLNDAPSQGWSGNFSLGDALLYSLGNTEIILDFSRDIWGGGAQVQRNARGNFIGSLEAYDAGLNFLGAVGLAGNSASGRDNSAIFLNLFSTDNHIRRLVFSVDNTNSSFAMNQVEFLQCFSPVPIPGTLILLGSGLLCLTRIRKRH